MCAHTYVVCVYTQSYRRVDAGGCCQLSTVALVFLCFQSFSLSLEFAGSAVLAGQLQGSANSTSEGWNYLLLAPLLTSGGGAGHPNSGPCACRVSTLTTEPSPQPKSDIFRISCLSPCSPPPPATVTQISVYPIIVLLHPRPNSCRLLSFLLEPFFLKKKKLQLFVFT